MKEGRDFAIIHKINSHFNDLNNDLNGINSFEEFANFKELRRAILFDFLQTGELTNQLSKRFLDELDNKDAYRLISIRNRIVHGYSTIRDDIIYNTLKNDLSPFVEQLNAFAKKRYLNMLKKLIGKRVTVLIDRPIGYKHLETIYSVNYGYIDVLTALDGEFQDAYVIGVEKPAEIIQGTVLAIIHREDDIEDKLIVSKRKANITDEYIEENITFIEKYYKHIIIRN